MKTYQKLILAPLIIIPFLGGTMLCFKKGDTNLRREVFNELNNRLGHEYSMQESRTIYRGDGWEKEDMDITAVAGNNSLSLTIKYKNGVCKKRVIHDRGIHFKFASNILDMLRGVDSTEHVYHNLDLFLPPDSDGTCGLYFFTPNLDQLLDKKLRKIKSELEQKVSKSNTLPK